jgi:hypothetical protein
MCFGTFVKLTSIDFISLISDGKSKENYVSNKIKLEKNLEEIRLARLRFLKNKLHLVI